MSNNTQEDVDKWCEKSRNFRFAAQQAIMNYNKSLNRFDTQGKRDEDLVNAYKWAEKAENFLKSQRLAELQINKMVNSSKGVLNSSKKKAAAPLKFDGKEEKKKVSDRCGGKIADLLAQEKTKNQTPVTFSPEDQNLLFGPNFSFSPAHITAYMTLVSTMYMSKKFAGKTLVPILQTIRSKMTGVMTTQNEFENAMSQLCKDVLDKDALWNAIKSLTDDSSALKMSQKWKGFVPLTSQLLVKSSVSFNKDFPLAPVTAVVLGKSVSALSPHLALFERCITNGFDENNLIKPIPVYVEGAGDDVEFGETGYEQAKVIDDKIAKLILVENKTKVGNEKLDESTMKMIVTKAEIDEYVKGTVPTSA